MFGLIADFTAHPGKRDEAVALMAAGSQHMPGCISYVISKDAADPDKIWITEVWETKEQHQASVRLPAVAATIDRVMPLLLRLGDLIETEPVGGVGLKPGKPR